MRSFRERTGKEKRFQPRDAAFGGVVAVDGSDLVVGAVFCAEIDGAAGRDEEHAKWAGDRGITAGTSKCTGERSNTSEEHDGVCGKLLLLR